MHVRPFARLLGLFAVLCAVFVLSACSSILPKTSPMRASQPLKQSVVDYEQRKQR